MTTTQTTAPTKVNTVETIMNDARVRQRFEGMLKDKAAHFISSLLTVWKQKLSDCEPWSVVQSAGIAASLELPIIPSLGYAAIVPYRESGKPIATFQMQWKGYVQLALRTNQYEKINVSEVYDDEFISWNPIANEFFYRPPSEWKNRYKEDGKHDHVVGYVSYFVLLNKFRHYYYMTKDEIMAHGKRYSAGFRKGKGLWVENPHVMCMKTPIKLNLNKFGILSVDLQRAMKYDSALLLPPPQGQEIESLNEPVVAEAESETEPPIAEPQEKKPDAPTAPTEAPKDYAAPARKPNDRDELTSSNKNS